MKFWLIFFGIWIVIAIVYKIVKNVSFVEAFIKIPFLVIIWLHENSNNK